MKINIKELYHQLYLQLGPIGWWPAETKLEIILGAILVQNTTWRNAQTALESLAVETRLVPQKILALSNQELESLIRSSGFYKSKAKTIVSIFEWLEKFDWNYELIMTTYGHNLRQELLKIKGIGFETADVLILYVFDQVTFIADAYARRLFSWLEEKEYQSYKQLYQSIELPQDFTLEEAQEFHGLIDEFGKLYFGKNYVEKNFLNLEKLRLDLS